MGRNEAKSKRLIGLLIKLLPNALVTQKAPGFQLFYLQVAHHFREERDSSFGFLNGLN